jgi:hypothetical protein
VLPDDAADLHAQERQQLRHGARKQRPERRGVAGTRVIHCSSQVVWHARFVEPREETPGYAIGRIEPKSGVLSLEVYYRYFTPLEVQ